MQKTEPKPGEVVVLPPPGKASSELEKLAKFLLEHHTDEITEGSAVDVAIKIMSKPNPTISILGFITHLCHNVHGVNIGYGYNPGNVMNELKKYCKLNGLPDPYYQNDISSIVFPPGV